MNQQFFSTLYQSSAIIANLFGRKRKFMYLGYIGSSTTEIKIADSKDAHHISLYMKMLDMVPGIHENAKDIRVIEFGCGRGGGCYVLKNYYHIQNITAVDLSSANIKLASKFVPNVKFISADAVEFNTEDKFDLVLNLESSHRYSSRLAFFKKIASMMNEDSWFVFGDLIRKHELEKVEKMFQESRLKIIKTETANDEVVKSINQNSPKQYPLVTMFPFLFPKRIHSFFVTIHSRAYSKLKSKDTFYNLYLLKKV